MTCQHHVEKCEMLKVSAVELGFTSDYVADLLERWGSDVLATAVELARNGLSTEFVIETLKKFGPFFLELFADLLNRKKSVGLSEEVTPCVMKSMDEVMFGLMVEKAVPKLAGTFLPDLWKSLQPILLELLTKLLLQNMKK